MSTKQPIKVTAEVKVFSPDGKLKSSTKDIKELPPDLILNQLKYILQRLLEARGAGDLFFTMTDITGTPRNLYYRGDGGAVKLMLDNLGGDVGGRLGIGDDGTAPTRADTELLSFTAEFDITAESVTASTIVKQGAWLATGAGTVRETGFYIYLADTAGVIRKFLIFRDTPTPQAYVLNDSVQVTYTIQL